MSACLCLLSVCMFVFVAVMWLSVCLSVFVYVSELFDGLSVILSFCLCLSVGVGGRVWFSASDLVRSYSPFT